MNIATAFTCRSQECFLYTRKKNRPTVIFFQSMVVFGGTRGVRFLQELHLKDKACPIPQSLHREDFSVASGDVAYPTCSNKPLNFPFLLFSHHSPILLACKLTYLSWCTCPIVYKIHSSRSLLCLFHLLHSWVSMDSLPWASRMLSISICRIWCIGMCTTKISHSKC